MHSPSGATRSHSSEAAARGLLRRGAARALALLLGAIICLVPIFYAPDMRVSIAPSEIRQELGKAYIVRIPSGAYGLLVATSDSSYSHHRSQLALHENGTALGPAHAPHATIREWGAGAYSHWDGYLYFSASDGSDPRGNGRTYVANAGTRLHHAAAGLLTLISIACLWAARREVKHRFAPKLVNIANAITLPGVSLRPATQFALAMAVTTAALAIAYLAAPQYKTNDDASMRLIAEGLIGDGSQRQFILFQNVLVGVFLRTLYGWVPTIPWYDLELTTSAVVGAFLCQIAVLRLCTSSRDIAFSAIASFLVSAPIFQAPQFTASAMLLAGGALLMCASVSYRPPAGPLGVYCAGAIILASFAAGCLIRFQAAFLVLAAAIPFIVLLGRRVRKEHLLLPTVAIGLAIALALLAQSLQTAYYARSPGWENVWNEARQRARATEHAHLDRSRAEEFRAALSAAGWTENDYSLLSNWLFADRQRFSADRMRQFADRAPRQALETRFVAVARHLSQPESLLGVFALLCLAPLLLRRTVPALWAAVASIVGVTGSLLMAGILFKPGLLHVTWPLYAVAVPLNALAIFATGRTKNTHDPYLVVEDKMVASAVLLGTMWLAGVQVQDIFARSAAAERVRQQLSYDLAEWPAKQGDTIVVWDNNFPYEIWARPLHPVPSVPWRLLHTNLASASPLADPIYSQWGTSDIAWSVCHVPGTFLVDAGHGHAEPHARILTAYMHEHHGEAVEVARIVQGRALALYRCRTAEKTSDK
jgi:hypothetical protein